MHLSLVQARGCPYYQSSREGLDSLKGSLAPPSTVTQVPLHESTRGGGKVECGEKFPCVPEGLEGKQQLQECVKGKEGWAGLSRSLEKGLFQMKQRRGQKELSGLLVVWGAIDGQLRKAPAIYVLIFHLDTSSRKPSSI